MLAHEFSLEHSFNKLETLLSYKDETNLQHFSRIALKKNCCHIKMTQNCSIFAKIVVKKSKVVSPLIFIGAFFQQTWNIVVLQRNHCFVVRKRPFFRAPNQRKQPQQHFIISLCKNLVVFASILFIISSLNLPSRRSYRRKTADRGVMIPLFLELELELHFSKNKLELLELDQYCNWLHS